MEPLTERFLTFVQSPSYKEQLSYLKETLVALGCHDLNTDEYGNLTATLAANIEGHVPVLGLIAVLHCVDQRRAPRPQLVENYRGGDIALGRGERILSPVKVPVLHQLHGHDLLTTDGEALLGAAQHAGIAVILTALEKLVAQPHGKLRLAFLCGPHHVGSHFDLKSFAADYPYLLYGSDQGGVVIDSANVADAQINIRSQPRAVCQSPVKYLACELAWECHQALVLQTTGDLGKQHCVWHLHSVKGSQTHAELHYQLCEVDNEKFAQYQRQMQQSTEQIQQRYQGGVNVSVVVRQTGRNRREDLATRPQLARLALTALQHCGIQIPVISQGSVSSAARWEPWGLPCPQLFSGVFNAPSDEEFVSLQVMTQSVKLIITLAALVAAEPVGVL